MDTYIFPCLLLGVGVFSLNKVLWKLSLNMVCTPKKADLGHKGRKINPKFFVWVVLPLSFPWKEKSSPDSSSDLFCP